MKRYFEQETYRSCGPSAIRNIMKQFGIEISEKYIRAQCKTTCGGTNAKNMMAFLRKRNLECQEYQTTSAARFKAIIVSGLKKGTKFVILTDSTEHWVAAIGYSKRRVKIVDTDFKVDANKIAPELTLRQLTDMCNNYNKILDKRYFYFIEIINTKDH